MKFAKFEGEHRRLAVLQMLEQKPAYTADETLIAKALAAEGLATSRDRLKTDLAWLEEQELIVVQRPGGVDIATLTVRGLDCANGYTSVPGVARPEPGA